MARTLSVLFGCASKVSNPCTSCQSVSSDGVDSYVQRWTDSFDRVEEWYDNRPSQMKSIFNVTASKREGLDQAFPIALYGNGAASKSTTNFTLSVTSGCWTNALQPLWIAGKAMSHHSEHTAIVQILVRIERETGWATSWRVEDLKEVWGEYDEQDCDVDMD
ncbi:unnamed protein product [Penicillium crustosum]